MKKVLFSVIIFMGCQLASVAQDAQDFLGGANEDCK